jgi:hypothetical protein
MLVRPQGMDGTTIVEVLRGTKIKMQVVNTMNEDRLIIMIEQLAVVVVEDAMMLEVHTWMIEVQQLVEGTTTTAGM